MKLTFEQWLKKVDEILEDLLVGLNSQDLPDMNYRDYYDEGTSPKRMAKIAMKNAGGD